MCLSVRGRPQEVAPTRPFVTEPLPRSADMELGMIGLGRMGANMTERLVRGGHRVITYDRSAEAIQRVVDRGAVGAQSLADFVNRLSAPRAVWLMVPSGDPVDRTIEELLPQFSMAVRYMAATSSSGAWDHADRAISSLRGALGYTSSI